MVEIAFRLPATASLEPGESAQMRVEFAKEVERLGYESFWFAHSLARDTAEFDVLELLAAIAVSTKRIKLGTAVLMVPVYHPVELARRLATIDLLSNGRLILGVGTGWIPKELENLSIPYKERAARTDEALDIIRKLWTSEEPVSYEGKYYQISDVYFEPKPAQKPHIPILYGALPPGAGRGAPEGDVKPDRWRMPAIRRAARSDGWLPGVSSRARRAELLLEGMELIRKAAQEEGRVIRDEEYDVSMTYALVNIQNTVELARKEAQAFYQSRVRRGFYQIQGNPPFDNLEEAGRFGPPAQVAGLVKELVELGSKVPFLRRVIIMFASLHPLEQLHRFHSDVAPLLKKG